MTALSSEEAFLIGFLIGIALTYSAAMLTAYHRATKAEIERSKREMLHDLRDPE